MIRFTRCPGCPYSARAERFLIPIKVCNTRTGHDTRQLHCFAQAESCRAARLPSLSQQPSCHGRLLSQSIRVPHFTKYISHARHHLMQAKSCGTPDASGPLSLLAMAATASAVASRWLAMTCLDGPHGESCTLLGSSDGTVRPNHSEQLLRRCWDSRGSSVGKCLSMGQCERASDEEVFLAYRYPPRKKLHLPLRDRGRCISWGHSFVMLWRGRDKVVSLEVGNADRNDGSSYHAALRHQARPGQRDHCRRRRAAPIHLVFCFPGLPTVLPLALAVGSARMHA